jgi:glutaconate CoA-transferase subunit B
LDVYGFDEASKRLTLLALHPGVTLDDIRANSACEILIPSEVGTTDPPTEDERRLLREIDPAGMVIGK